MENNKEINQENIQEETNQEVVETTPTVKLEEDDGTGGKFSLPWKGLIFIGIIIVLMIVCIIVIGLNGGFNA